MEDGCGGEEGGDACAVGVSVDAHNRDDTPPLNRALTLRKGTAIRTGEEIRDLPVPNEMTIPQ